MTKNNHYSFDNLVSEFKATIDLLPDNRRGANKSYRLSDAALGAFSVFFTQSPSFLSHQTRLKEMKGENNAQSLFQVERIPSDNHIRKLLDPISPDHMEPMYDYVFDGLKSNGYFESCRSINGNILILMDGVNYHTSHKIHCESCNHRKPKDGPILYLHNAVTPVIASPGNSRVVSLSPEFITPQDGHDKQDGEHAASKRWLEKHAHKYADLGVTILGDDLYAHQPFCENVLAQGMHFILTCKPKSHKVIYQQIDFFSAKNRSGAVTTEVRRGKKKYTYSYRYVNCVPMRDSTDALNVNWCELIITDEKGKKLNTFAYITDHKITDKNIAEIIEAGRARWKVENENNNVLKNHGYNLEHNFGHGKEYLSQLMLTFNLLAFLFHTTLDILDEKYKEVRDKMPTRKAFFNDLRALTSYIPFRDWDTLLAVMCGDIKLQLPDTG